MNEQSSGQSPAQGWYTDPHNASQLRWWDGTAWTDHTHPPAGETAAAAAPAAQAEPAAAAATHAAATPAASAQPAAATTPAQRTPTTPAQQTPAATAPGTGGIVSNPAPSGGASSGSGEKGAVAQWFSVRSNQILFVVLLVAIVLFIYVMAGGAS